MTKPFLNTADDCSTEAGAQRLADRLNAFWHQRGYKTVTHWIKPVRVLRPTNGQPTQHTTWVVRSNLVRGLPPKQQPDATNPAPPRQRQRQREWSTDHDF